MAPQVTIRPANEADLPGILAIYNDAILNTTATYDTEPETLAQRAAWLQERRAQHMPILVAVANSSSREDAAGGHVGKRDATIVGFAALSPHSAKPGYRHTVMNSVYVAPDARGLGLGTLLLTELLRRAREIGAHVVIASIDAENEASLKLHRKLGFRKVAHLHEVGWKFGRWLDVVYMQLTIPEEGPMSKYARRAAVRKASA